MFYWVLSVLNRLLLGFSLRLRKVLLFFSGLDRIELPITGFYWVLLFFLGFIGLNCLLLGFSLRLWKVLAFTWLYRVSLSLNEFYWVLLGYSLRLKKVMLGFTGLYRVELPFTGFYWVFL